MLLWTFHIVGYLYITLFIYCVPGICSLNIVLYIRWFWKHGCRHL